MILKLLSKETILYFGSCNCLFINIEESWDWSFTMVELINLNSNLRIQKIKQKIKTIKNWRNEMEFMIVLIIIF